MIQLTPEKRNMLKEIQIKLEALAASNAKCIEQFKAITEQRKKEHNDKIMWLLSRGEKLPPHVKLLT